MTTRIISRASLLWTLVLSLLSATTAQQQPQQQTRQHLRRNTASTRIIGGTVSKVAYPFYALWEVGCGASLIHDDILLTAAHCYMGDMFARRVWMGGLQPNEGIVRDVTHVTRHPSYSETTNAFDYAILKLNASALVDHVVAAAAATSRQAAAASVPAEEEWTTIPTGLKPIALNTDASIPQAQESLTIMGFGLIDPQGAGLQPNLNEVTVVSIPKDDCKNAYPRLFDPSVMMCAGAPDRGGRDSCQGDSGGPMVSMNAVDGSLSQVGVVSWGEGCGEAEHPGVYAEVASAHDWIQDQICQQSCFPPPSCDPAVAHPCAKDPTQGGPPADADLTGTTRLSIQVTLDTYPSEFAVILKQMETGSELWYVGYGSFDDSDSPANDLMVLEHEVADLPAGIYQLTLGDRSRDGVCCRYGAGNVKVTNVDTGEELWSDDGNYGASLEVFLNLDAAGEVIWVADNAEGLESTETDPETINDDIWAWLGDTESEGDGNTPFDYDPTEESEEWPGAFPSGNADVGTVMLNVRSDEFPDETSWFWERRTGPLRFETVTSGKPSRGNTLYSTALSLDPETVYRLHLQDLAGDGTCCLYGGGWFTVTNNTATADHADGSVLWRMTGNGFVQDEHVFFWADAAGKTHWVEYIPGEGYALMEYNVVQEERIFVVPERSIDRHWTMFP